MTETIESVGWETSNQQFLVASLGCLREKLLTGLPENEARNWELKTDGPQPEQIRERMESAPALERISRQLGLSEFETDILLLCAGVELDSSFSALVSRLLGDHSRQLPTFGLAMALLPNAHWSAMSGNSPLRYWRLIDVTQSSVLMSSPIRVDEAILDFLTGSSHLDERLLGVVEPVADAGQLSLSQFAVVRSILATCANSSDPYPLIQLTGPNHLDKASVAFHVAARMGMQLFELPSQSTPSDPKAAKELVRLWNRESVLRHCALYIDCVDLERGQTQSATVTRFIDNLHGLAIVGSGLHRLESRRTSLGFEVLKPSWDEQLEIWNKELGFIGLNGHLKHVASHFDLATRSIRSASEEARKYVGAFPDLEVKDVSLFNIIQDSCRTLSRAKLDELAQRILPMASLSDIILPEREKQRLREIIEQVQQRKKVYGYWGINTRTARGLGVTALFHGESGTGKTLAAEILACELGYDLYKIDLSQVVSKYIGDTERALQKVFDAAEDGGVVLLFDEADALFGKRSEVRDSHDRYANIEVSFLLQKMEAYNNGLTILTTNLKSSIDQAFLRRLRFVVQFPFPGKEQREKIWRNVFPASMSVGDLDFEKLARLSISGGNIRNIAITASFLATADVGKVEMNHVTAATHSEYEKMEKALSMSEISSLADAKL